MICGDVTDGWGNGRTVRKWPKNGPSNNSDSISRTNMNLTIKIESLTPASGSEAFR